MPTGGHFACRFAPLPESRAVGRCGRSVESIHDACPVKVKIARRRDICDIQECRQPIGEMHQVMQRAAIREILGPRHDRGDSNASLVHVTFATCELTVVAMRARGPLSEEVGPVVAREENKRLFFQPAFSKGVQDSADPSVHPAHHRVHRLDRLCEVLPVSEPGDFLLRSFERSVRSVVREIEKERMMGVPFDEAEGFGREDIGQVATVSPSVGCIPIL